MLYLTGVWKGRVERELLARLDFGTHFLLDLIKHSAIGQTLLGQPAHEQFERIAVRFPAFFLFSGTVVGPLNVADVMPEEAVGVAE